MSPESKSHLAERIRYYQSFYQTPEASSFNDQELFSLLSAHNQKLLSPIRSELQSYNACLHSVARWQDHPIRRDLNLIGDTDYEHVLEMLKISQSLKQSGVSGFNFDDIELMILFHDGGEIITGDISLIHSSDHEDFAKDMKKIESNSFIKCVLSQIRQKTPDLYQEIKSLYLRYESRQSHPDDKESHLVKFIDNLQGDYYGLEHIYNRLIIDPIYDRRDQPIDSSQVISASIRRECLLLKKVTQATGQKNSQIFENFLSQWQETSYGNPQFGYHSEYLSCRFSC